MTDSAEQLYAELYDALGVGWPDEMAFYLALAGEMSTPAQSVLEIACGTGRIALTLARMGFAVTGIDRSAAMVSVARAKSASLPNTRWAVADMRTLDLGARFGLVFIPAHAFQFMLTPDDQLACLAAVRRHLAPGGTLVLHLDHQDLDWLGALPSDPAEATTETRAVVHPTSGRRFTQTTAWTYARATQTATLMMAWDEVDAAGAVVGRWELPPTPLHCAFRTEIEHLLARAGYIVDALYGDFARRPLTDESTEMIWVVRHAGD